MSHGYVENGRRHGGHRRRWSVALALAAVAVQLPSTSAHASWQFTASPFVELGGQLEISSIDPCPTTYSDGRPLFGDAPFVYVGIAGDFYWAVLWGLRSTNSDGSWSLRLDMPTNIYSLTLPTTRAVMVSCLDAEILPQPDGTSWTRYNELARYDDHPVEIRPAPTPPRPIGNYVALGDSWSSGEANAPYDEGTDTFIGRTRLNGCHRSAAAWPRLIQNDVRHLACSGAGIRAFTQGQELVAPDDTGQFDRLATIEAELRQMGDSVDTVTVTIGADALGITERLLSCWTGPRCFSNERAWQAEVDGYTFTIAGLLDNVRLRAPSAKIVLVGVPRLLPETSAENATCGWLSSTERVAVNSFSARLDTVLQSAATFAGVSYVSTLDALDGHELCSTEPWLSGLSPAPSGRSEMARPLVQAQQRIADVVRPVLEQA